MEIGGKKINNWYVVGGVAGLVLVVYLYRRSSSGSSSSSAGAASSSASSGVDPLTGLPYSQDNSVDPLTGMTYLQEAQTYGSVAAAEAQGGTGSGYGLSGGYGSGGYVGTAGYPTTNVGAGSAAGQSYATNAAWAQAVTAGLAALGYDSQTVASALGLFFAQHPLSADQAQIVQAAEAEWGPPPQGTYQIIPQGSGTGSGGGSSSGGTTPPPPPPPSGGGPEPVAWVAAQWVNRTSTNVHWPPAKGATSYQVRVTYQSQVIQTHTTDQQNFTVSGLTPNHTYGIHVAAIEGGKPWEPEASTSIHTPK
jgi:hypothetical protein